VLERARAGLRLDLYGSYTRWLLRTLYLGLGFLASQVMALQQLVTQGLFMRHNPHSSMFYIVTASHGLHLFGGLIALGYLLLRATSYLDMPLIFAVLVAIFVVVLHFSRWGRQLYAIGNNKEAARFSGINVNRVKLVLFILSGVIAALAGVLYLEHDRPAQRLYWLYALLPIAIGFDQADF